MSVVSGDIVNLTAPDAAGQGLVVVDAVPGDPPYPAIAVLRDPSDLELLFPIVQPQDALEVIGHLTELEGWEEFEHGQWVHRG